MSVTSPGRRWGMTRGALALRGVVFAGPTLALLATALDGPGPRVLLVLVVVGASAVFAMRPESPLGVVALGLVVVWWGLAVRTHLPLVAVPAAWLLLASHVSSVVLSHGPKELPVDRGLLRRWVWRGGLLALAAPALWLLADAVSDQPEPEGIWIAGLAAAIVVCVVAAGAVTVRPSAR